MRPAAACLTSDPSLRAFVRGSLAGFSVRFFASAADFLGSPPSRGLALIDSALPDMPGADVVAVLRGDRKTSGLLLVLAGNAHDAPGAAARLFDSGADEYFRLPADPALFRARLLNLLAREASRAPAPAGPEEYGFGPLRISPEARTASVDGKRVRVTALEFDMLLYFLRNQGRVVSRSVLLEQVWRQGMASGARAVDKRIEALRRKLGRFGAKIRTVFGLGYIFKM